MKLFGLVLTLFCTVVTFQGCPYYLHSEHMHMFDRWCAGLFHFGQHGLHPKLDGGASGPGRTRTGLFDLPRACSHSASIFHLGHPILRHAVGK